MKKWTNQEKNFLIENYLKLGRRECSKILNRTEIGVYKRARKMGFYIHIENREKLEKELIGEKFGKLTVVNICEEMENGRTKWKCLCDCGKEVKIQYNLLKSGNNKSCGCLNHRGGKDNPRFTGCGEISGDYLYDIKWGCHRPNKKLEYNVSKEYLWNLFLKQNRKCALSGVELFFPKSGDFRYGEQTASLDRIDSNVGYIEGNVQWLHKDVNQMKMDFPEEKFLQYIEYIYKTKIKNSCTSDYFEE